MTRLTALVALALAGLLAGCAAGSQARSVQESGFLGDYSMLSKGKEGEALMVYKNPNANWASYDKVLLDPVTVWMGADSQMQGVPPEDSQHLADLLYFKIKNALQDDYKFVTAPGPGVLHLQVAITQADTPNAVMHTVGNIVPQMMVLSQLKKAATGTQSFVGQASIEGKMTDGATGALLMAAVDKRAGGKGFARATESVWADIDRAYGYWADKLKYRLCQSRGGANCVEPKE